MYYPKSQIKPNLYTNGKEYILSTTKEDYIGYYYEISTGQKYTGKDPQDKTNILLILQNPDLLSIQEIANKGLNYIETQDELSGGEYKNVPLVRYIPIYNKTYPTDQQILQEEYTRYFCKKNNELIYIEIDNPTYQLLQNKSSTIAWDLYTPTTIPWKIGDQAYLQNQSSVLSIEQNLKWYGFSQYFKGNFSSFPTSTRK
jgi:hypothetical protein